jgi:hypothetical protein
VPSLVRRQAVVGHVAVAVQLRVVAALGELPSKGGVGLDLLTDEDERGARRGCVESVEQGGGGFLVGTVVEGEHDPSASSARSRAGKRRQRSSVSTCSLK